MEIGNVETIKKAFVFDFDCTLTRINIHHLLNTNIDDYLRYNPEIDILLDEIISRNEDKINKVGNKNYFVAYKSNKNKLLSYVHRILSFDSNSVEALRQVTRGYDELLELIKDFIFGDKISLLIIFLELLKKNGFDLYVISNATECDHIAILLRIAGLYEYFEKIGGRIYFTESRNEKDPNTAIKRLTAESVRFNKDTKCASFPSDNGNMDFMRYLYHSLKYNVIYYIDDTKPNFNGNDIVRQGPIYYKGELNKEPLDYKYYGNNIGLKEGGSGLNNEIILKIEKELGFSGGKYIANNKYINYKKKYEKYKRKYLRLTSYYKDRY